MVDKQQIGASIRFIHVGEKQKPDRGRKPLAWMADPKWFMIQLALVAKDLLWVPEDKPAAPAAFEADPSPEKRKTRPKRPNLAAAKFAVLWAYGLKPSVRRVTKDIEAGRDLIRFRKADLRASKRKSLHFPTDVEHVRKHMQLEVYLESDLARLSDNVLVRKPRFKHLSYGDLRLDTANLIEHVHHALCNFLLPGELEFEAWKTSVTDRCIRAEMPWMAEILFAEVSEIPLLVDRVAHVGKLAARMHGSLKQQFSKNSPKAAIA